MLLRIMETMMYHIIQTIAESGFPVKKKKNKIYTNLLCYYFYTKYK